MKLFYLYFEFMLDRQAARSYNTNNLFALHYIPNKNARSTVQTEQAMDPRRVHGAGPFKDGSRLRLRTSVGQ